MNKLNAPFGRAYLCPFNIEKEKRVMYKLKYIFKLEKEQISFNSCMISSLILIKKTHEQFMNRHACLFNTRL